MMPASNSTIVPIAEPLCPPKGVNIAGQRGFLIGRGVAESIYGPTIRKGFARAAVKLHLPRAATDVAKSNT